MSPIRGTSLSGFHDLKPSHKRAIASARISIWLGNSAFLIGAGFDRALKEDCKGWTELVKNLAGPNCAQDDARDWPTEMALLAQYRYERKEDFKKAVLNEISKKEDWTAADKRLQRALIALFQRSNLVVTLNYSLSIDEAVNIAAKKVGNVVEILDREDLPSFRFPDPMRVGEKNQKVYLVHLHGRCSATSQPILDAWGYNVVTNHDPYYVRFLENLFSERDVISFGVSWIDIPLRNSAALVRRTKTYAGRSHLAFRYVGSKCRPAKDSAQANSDAAWACAMRASYGVEPISVTDKSQLLLLKELSHPVTGVCSPYPITSLKGVADLLDDTGDFESLLQVKGLLNTRIGKIKSDRRTGRSRLAIADIIRALLEVLISELNSHRRDSWEYAARIERHLRHHIYLYLPLEKDILRKRLWLKIARAKQDWIGALDDRTKFDFVIGAIELGIGSHDYLDRFPFSKVFSDRIRYAPEVWPSRISAERIDENENRELVTRLLDIGWESIAAKVVLDRVRPIVKASKKLGPEVVTELIMESAERAEGLALLAGATRRRLKAEVILSMWDPQASQGRLRIRSALRRIETEGELEPGLYSSLFAGLIVSGARSYLKASLSVNTVVNELFQYAREMGFDERLLNSDQLIYWKDYAPIEYRKFLFAAQRLFA